MMKPKNVRAEIGNLLISFILTQKKEQEKTAAAPGPGNSDAAAVQPNPPKSNPK
jgi:hypothetical protein